MTITPGDIILLLLTSGRIQVISCQESHIIGSLKEGIINQIICLTARAQGAKHTNLLSLLPVLAKRNLREADVLLEYWRRYH